MIPLKDINPRHRTPIVTIIFILLNVVIYFLEVGIMFTGTEESVNAFFDKWAFIPNQFFSKSMVVESITLLSSIFLHGGLMHLLGNMWFLWVFGDNIEDKIGHFRYLMFYLLSGAFATFAQLAIDVDSAVPVVGASGAIAGILGAYLILFPKVPVNTLIFFIFRKRISALIVLGFWFAMQFFNGLGSLSQTAEGGIAFFAHIGGFLAGMVLIFLFRPAKELEPNPPSNDWDDWQTS